MKNNPEFIDKPATLEAIRKKYGSVAAFCREVPIHPRLFYKALAEDLGRCRRSSFSRDAMELLESEGLMVRGESTSVKAEENA